jgi:putative transposase
LADRRRRLLTDHIDLLRTAFRHTRARHPFAIEAIVVLPDHLHAIWTLPEGEADFAMRWRLIKAAFSHALPRTEPISASRQAKGERGIWQRRYWEHTIRNATDFERHMDYVHFNPMKHGLVARVQDWPHSSFHRMVRLGIYPGSWAGDAREAGSSFGEGDGSSTARPILSEIHAMGFAPLNPSYSPDEPIPLRRIMRY